MKAPSVFIAFLLSACSIYVPSTETLVTSRNQSFASAIRDFAFASGYVQVPLPASIAATSKTVASYHRKNDFISVSREDGVLEARASEIQRLTAALRARRIALQVQQKPCRREVVILPFAP